VNIRFAMIAAVASLAIASAVGTSQASVVGPSSAVQSSAQSLDQTEKARRVCRQQLKCPRFLQCHWEKQCYVTKDYPPEHGRR
jgi:hypothetical protein